MSADHYQEENHLTPGGWIRGTFFFYGHATKIVPPPADRVLTLIKDVFQASGFSAEEISWKEAWRSTDDKAVAKLTKKFGGRPEED